MNAETQIKNKLFKNLGLKKVDILNNSHLHNNHNSSPKSGKSHFKIIIKDKDLFRLPKIKSHQKIYTCRRFLRSGGHNVKKTELTVVKKAN